MRESLYSFNRGVVSPLALARVDAKRVALAAALQQNYMPRVLGPMMLRPGTSYLGTTYTSAPSKFIPFVKATNDTALLEVSSLSSLIPWVNDTPVVIPPVTTTDMTNPAFHLNIVGWTVNDEAGATSAWAAGDYLSQSSSNGFATAIVDQVVTVAGANIGKEHSLYITVSRGPVVLRVGTSTTDDSYVNETTLETGTHWLSFTPTGNFNVRFKNRNQYVSLVKLCTIINSNVAAPLSVPHPWAPSDLSLLRWEQSADVIFVAAYGKQQQRIERRGVHSWSLVTYKSPDGPFLTQNSGATTVTPTALTGDITITSSQPLWRSTHVGALFKLKSQGQIAQVIVTAQDQWTDPVQIIGVGIGRNFYLDITGVTATGSSVRLQQSIGAPGIWINTSHFYTVDQVAVLINDSPVFDNQIVYYRLGVLVGAYVAGTITCKITYSSGAATGIVRITSFASSSQVGAQVLDSLGGTAAATTWSEGTWSDVRGWPSGVALHEGRLWWSGKNGVFGSVSDAFDSFDDTLVGDAGPIVRTIGSGPVDTVNWMLPLQRLLLGTQGAEFSLRASAIDDIMTPTNFNVRTIGNQGSAAVPAQKIDQSGVFVSRTGRRAYKLDFGFQFYDYAASDLTALCPTILEPGVVRLVTQRQPDTRLHFIRSDGVVVICVQDSSEEVTAFITYVTNGVVEDAVVLPALAGNTDDQVYYVVKRTINGATVRYVEKWAQESEAIGATVCKLADAHVVYQGAAATVITGLAHLNGQQVVVWADGQDVGTNDSAIPWVQRYTVAAGQITLAAAASNVVVGLGYTAQFQSAKLGVSLAGGSLLNMSKNIDQLGLILANVHTKGVQFGADFAHLDDMPGTERGAPVTPGVNATYDEQSIDFPGTWTTDMRVCLQSVAPRPATIMALSPSFSEEGVQG